MQEIASWTQQNQLHLNPDKTTSTLFTPDPAEYSTQLTLNIDNVVIPTVKNPKILGLTFDPKLTYNSHIRKTSDKARNTLKLLKALTSTKWGKQKETIVATYKAITRPILEYASTIWSPIASTTGITKLQTIQNITSSHLFECKYLPTSLSSLDLWTNPDKVEPFLATWGERLLAAT